MSGGRLAAWAAVAGIVSAIIAIAAYAFPRGPRSDIPTPPAYGQASPAVSGVGAAGLPATSTTASTGTTRPATPATTARVDGPDITAPPPAIMPAYLVDIPVTDGGHATILEGKQTILGQDYLRSVYLCSELSAFPNINCNSSETNPYYMEYTAPKDMQTFRTTIGFSDISPSTCKVQVTVYIANVSKFDQTLVVGSKYDRTWPVATGSRIKLSVLPLPGAGRCRTVFGDARFEP